MSCLSFSPGRVTFWGFLQCPASVSPPDAFPLAPPPHPSGAQHPMGLPETPSSPLGAPSTPWVSPDTLYPSLVSPNTCSHPLGTPRLPVPTLGVSQHPGGVLVTPSSPLVSPAPRSHPGGCPAPCMGAGRPIPTCPLTPCPELKGHPAPWGGSRSSRVSPTPPPHPLRVPFTPSPRVPW